jgi:anti-anti-sigma factor
MTETSIHTLNARTVDGVPVLGIAGEMDFRVVESLNRAIAEAGAADAGAVVLSLEHMSYVDSHAISAFFKAIEQLRLSRQELLMVAPAVTAGKRILDITGLSDAVPVFYTVSGAIEEAKQIVERRRSEE